nr:GntR family transcriptional regulator [Diplocloster modestus]
MYIDDIHILIRGERVNIIISNSSGKPIYEQITSQIKNMIVAGELKPGEALPSMRLLAKELRISVITTKRAYEDLERDGYIYSVVGKGSFVADANMELVKEEHLRRIEENLQNAVEAARISHIELQELQDILTMLYKDEG